MTLREIIRQGFYYARTCKPLWLFGFFVGLGSGGSGGAGGGGGDGAGGGLPLDLSGPQVAVIIALFAFAIAAVVMHFISQGALIEGVERARKGGMMTTGEGFRRGWAHWGVLLRIGLLYVAAIVASLVLLAAPVLIALRALGPVGGAAVGMPMLLIAVPWLITLYLVQVFASRIAVLENRHAIDAIGKSRLFLHGRLMHGLKLIVAAFAGTLALAVIGLLTIVPVVLVLAALMPVLRLFTVLALGSVVLLPVMYVLIAITGTFRSSIWTIGYLTEMES